MTNYYHLERFAILREGFRCIASADDSLHAVGDGNSEKLFLHELKNVRVDVLLLDLDIDAEETDPLNACLSFCKILKQRYPSVLTILHSPYKHAYWIDRFFRSGVRGFVSKNSGYDQIIKGIRTVEQGSVFVCPLIAEQFSNYPEFLLNPSIALKPVNTLFTPRELDVLEKLIKGNSTKEIAGMLYVSEKTVETHRRNLVEKAQVKNTAELVSFVSLKGLVIH